jgi:aldehyde reductase
MPVLAPALKLSSGYNMPVLGLGTYQADKKGEVKQAVIEAIEAGYRHIDGARVYENEKEVGAGIKAKIDDGTVKREDLFVVSKLWDTYHRPERVLTGIKKTLEDLKLEYLDLYLMHWPMALKPTDDDDLFPKDAQGNFLVDNEVDFVDTWKQMEELVRLGLTKSIGISNFNSKQIERILENATIPPAVIQVEVHPYLPQKKLLEFCKKKGIKVTAYSPFGNPVLSKLETKLLEEPKLLELGKKYGKGANHIILKWLLQRELITTPKSVTKSRIIDNFNVFDFTLTDEEMKEIESLDKGPKGRVFQEDFLKTSKDYPFNIEF